MTNILKLEKRGCDFWKDSPEATKSDLQNFRLCGVVDGKDKKYFLEIGTWTTVDKNRKKYLKEKYGLDSTHTWIDNSFKKREILTVANGEQKEYIGEYRDAEKLETYCHPTKTDVLATINRVFGCNYDAIEIVQEANLNW